ncbi:MAG: hypothetical protein AAGF92_21385 [Myxococcota bacterium]
MNALHFARAWGKRHGVCRVDEPDITGHSVRVFSGCVARADACVMGLAEFRDSNRMRTTPKNVSRIRGLLRDIARTQPPVMGFGEMRNAQSIDHVGRDREVLLGQDFIRAFGLGLHLHEAHLALLQGAPG